jgi:hypothetical protein
MSGMILLTLAALSFVFAIGGLFVELCRIKLLGKKESEGWWLPLSVGAMALGALLVAPQLSSLGSFFITLSAPAQDATDDDIYATAAVPVICPDIRKWLAWNESERLEWARNYQDIGYKPWPENKNCYQRVAAAQ